MKKNEDQLTCSFCGKPKELVNRLVAGPNGIYICDECVDICREIILEETNAEKNASKKFELLKPYEIKEKLDELAKREIAVIYTHPNMIIKNDFWDQLNYHKENLVPFGQWIEAEDLPTEITETVLKNMRKLIRFIKADPRFRITTYSKLAAELEKEGTRIVKKEQIPEIYKKSGNFLHYIRGCICHTLVIPLRREGS